MCPLSPCIYLLVEGMKDINLLSMIRYGMTIIFGCHLGEVAVASIYTVMPCYILDETGVKMGARCDHSPRGRSFVLLIITLQRGPGSGNDSRAATGLSLTPSDRYRLLVRTPTHTDTLANTASRMQRSAAGVAAAAFGGDASCCRSSG